MWSVVIFGLYLHTLVEVARFSTDDMQTCFVSALVITEQAAGKQFAFCLNPLLDF